MHQPFPADGDKVPTSPALLMAARLLPWTPPLLEGTANLQCRTLSR